MAVNICQFATRNAWQKPILKLLLAVLATLTTMHWLRQLLLEPIGNIPPAEFEMAYYRQLQESADAT